MISIYSLTMVCLILPGAKIQDIMGRKETFILGVFIYGIGALISTLSINISCFSWMVFLGEYWGGNDDACHYRFLSATYHGEDRNFVFGSVQQLCQLQGL